MHAKKFTVLLKHVNSYIKVVATTENTHYEFDRSCSQKIISIWQGVWSNGKMAVYRSRMKNIIIYNFMVDVLLE